ncbi:hypothetical protein SAMN05421788_104396 [Filimonas lacunae]|uniref:Glycosyltransferase family 61 protein n=1 Tax=Filimonas lacunae TaxID=477680 RepID=A0A173MRF2_9BACT|nr:hypothetical protein [Filimonas lacunae]BAV10233.1 hypothetical protein FLA_6294 [Filimonas lacunae]SIT17997.1 hypothetical protein SAMN05421788_104396 [Filimonas lacunae]
MFTPLINKILSLLVSIRYGDRLPIDVRYFYRDTYYCQLVQWKYLIKDYITKKPYKEIDFQGEFTPELAFVLPFAYWHHQNGTLQKTVSSKYTKELYFFSKEHEERFDVRTTIGNYNYETPRILYSQNYNMSKWIQVPLKQQYQNDIYVFDKPVLILANRYNMEWDGPPISFFSIEMLAFIIEKLKHKYTIIYNRPRPQNITNDNSDIYDMDEYEWLEKQYPEVILMENLWKENKGKARNFNHLQLMVYANASHFISIHGGTCALASYFGGINLILSKKGPEHHFKCFEILYPRLSGAKILHAKTDEDVQNFVEAYYV